MGARHVSGGIVQVFENLSKIDVIFGQGIIGFFAKVVTTEERVDVGFECRAVAFELALDLK